MQSTLEEGLLMDKMVYIRRAQIGDENSLAYVQTESWKEAFKEIIPAELLSECTKTERAAAMYKRLLEGQKGNGYILENCAPHSRYFSDELGALIF